MKISFGLSWRPVVDWVHGWKSIDHTLHVLFVERGVRDIVLHHKVRHFFRSFQVKDELDMYDVFPYSFMHG